MGRVAYPRRAACILSEIMKTPWIAALLLLAAPLRAETDWTFQLSLGEVANLDTSLKIRQEGEPTLDLDADYETRPFESPFYYSLRAGRWNDSRAWELELIHQKIFLTNRPPEVQHFAVSHGYNLLTVNRAWDVRRFLWRIGAGAVVAHPESEVRGRALDSGDTNLGGGYHLTGPVLQIGIEKRFELGILDKTHWLLGVEGKASAARAVIPVAGGEADAPNAALHLLVGFGWQS
jgi:hypothetical protein